ncbi:MAG TPA: PIG-L family deacetylase [Acidimicrobiales bacterium]|nr:PIG-L family deacetylase [Acidimicrobiales bacterium]
MPVELLGEAPRRAVAIYAHPDDSDVSCGGTLARWADAGCAVDLIVCAAGDKGTRDAAMPAESLVAARAAEIEAAAAVLGLAGVHRLGRPDGEFENDVGLRGELVALLRELRPEVLVCPDPLAVFFGEHYYNHRDHRAVGFAALDAAAPAAASPLYFPEAGSPHAVSFALLSGSLEPNVCVEVTATVGRKGDAVCCHMSQLGDAGESFRAVMEERAAEAGRAAGVDYAEAFRRIWLGR